MFKLLNGHKTELAVSTHYAVQVKNLHLSYGKSPVLYDLDLNVKAGTFLGIVGPNGVGKSSLIKCFLGINPLKKSSVFIQGTDLTSLKQNQIAELISYVPQNSEPLTSFTVKEIVEMALYYNGSSKAPAEINKNALIDKWLDDLGLLDFKNRPVNQISGGEYQKVLMARALLQNTPIIVLDEPTNHLDLSHQLSILELLKKEQSENDKTIIAIFHDLNLALRFCDSICVLNQGRIIEKFDSSSFEDPDLFQEIFNLRFDFIKHENHKLLVPELRKDQ